MAFRQLITRQWVRYENTVDRAKGRFTHIDVPGLRFKIELVNRLVLLEWYSVVLEEDNADLAVYFDRNRISLGKKENLAGEATRNLPVQTEAFGRLPHRHYLKDGIFRGRNRNILFLLFLPGSERGDATDV